MSLPKLVLGLDPGTFFLGFCLYKTGEPTARKIGAARFDGRPNFRLGWAQEFVEGLVEEITKTSPEKFEAVIESVYLWKNVQALVMLARAQGAIIPIFARRGIAVHEYHASKIKKALTGDGRAKKPIVAQSVKRLLHLEEELPLDATDAAGLAYFHANRSDLFGSIEG